MRKKASSYTDLLIPMEFLVHATTVLIQVMHLPQVWKAAILN